MALYGRVDYWDERYRSSPKSSDEWYQSYRSLRHLLNPIHFAAQGNGVRSWNRPQPSAPEGVASFPARDACRILILGCGNSCFGEDMRKEGWLGPMVNLDFSQVVIDQMKERCQDQMDFVCHDMTTGLPFADESFDLIICKGSFDALLCSAGSVANIRRLVQESVRCLACGHGVFFIVTHGNPDNRLVALEHENDIAYHWDGVSVHRVERPATRQSDYVYICRRRQHPNPPTLPVEAVADTAPSKENQENRMASAPKREPLVKFAKGS